MKSVAEITKTLGLRPGMDYSIEENKKTLRYGSLCILTDQDHDGSHICGLIINLFRMGWPQLIEMGYLKRIITPLIKVTTKTGTVIKKFYDDKKFSRLACSK